MSNIKITLSKISIENSIHNTGSNSIYKKYYLKFQSHSFFNFRIFLNMCIWLFWVFLPKYVLLVNTQKTFRGSTITHTQTRDTHIAENSDLGYVPRTRWEHGSYCQSAPVYSRSPETGLRDFPARFARGPSIINRRIK